MILFFFFFKFSLNKEKRLKFTTIPEIFKNKHFIKIWTQISLKICRICIIFLLLL